MNRNLIFALASLIGAIIGAGIFAMPYVMVRAGILPVLFCFLILGAVVCLLHLFFGEIILRTKEKHRLVGYAEKYLGKQSKPLMAAASFIGMSGSLLAYIILAGKFSALILPNVLSAFGWSLAAWLALSFLVLLGIKSIAPVEFFMNIGLFLVLIVIFVFCLPKVDSINFDLLNKSNLFLPFGIVLFSLIGTSAVPEVVGILQQKKDLKKIIFFASLTTVCFTFLFGFIISGVTGPKTTDEPFQGLSAFLGSRIIILGAVFGLLAVATSYLILANHLKNMLRFDYRFPYFLSFVIACFTPFLLFWLGLRDFIPVIGIIGVFIGLIEGAAICLIYRKAKKQGDQAPAYNLKTSNLLIYFIIVILALGALSQIIYR